MFEVDWSKDKGWQTPKIVPYGPIKIPITATSLHYGISCYEALNVVRNKVSGKPQAFRAD
jgi:branched-chain amino acid aminotransferase